MAERNRQWRLVLLVDRNGLPCGYTLVPANEKEHEPVRELALADGSALLVADKEAMKAAIAGAAGVAPTRVAVKATTNEELGFIGRREGIVAMASASIELPRED